MRQAGCLKPQCLLNVSFSSSKMLFLVPQHQSSSHSLHYRTERQFYTEFLCITSHPGLSSQFLNMTKEYTHHFDISFFFFFLHLNIFSEFNLNSLVLLHVKSQSTRYSVTYRILSKTSQIVYYKDYFCSSVMIFEINKEIFLAATESTLSLLLVQGSLKQRTHR